MINQCISQLPVLDIIIKDFNYQSIAGLCLVCKLWNHKIGIWAELKWGKEDGWEARELKETYKNFKENPLKLLYILPQNRSNWKILWESMSLAFNTDIPSDQAHAFLRQIPELPQYRDDDQFLSLSKKSIVFMFSKLNYIPLELKFFKFNSVNFSENCIIELPIISEDVTTLNLQKNKIRTIPSTSTECYKQLKTLSLGFNLIKDFDINKGFDNLEYLHLSNNKFTIFPFNVSLCSHLTDLDISHNEIETVPENVIFENLKFFDISHNNIKSLFPVTKLFPRLERLNVSNNKIEILFKEIVVRDLCSLNISNNPITEGEITREIYPNLKVVFISEDQRKIFGECFSNDPFLIEIIKNEEKN